MQTLIVDAALISHEESPLEGTQCENLSQFLNGLRTPNLKTWLSKAVELQSTTLSEESLNTPLEEAIRLCLDPSSDEIPISNGLTGHAHALALQLHPHEVVQAPPLQGWALITLCHWHVNSGQVIMLEAQPLDEQSSETLRIELSPFFSQLGISLFKYMPGVWLAKSEVFHALPTSSISRAMGQEVEPWLVGNTFAFPQELTHQSQTLKRLQSEVQMLLYQHPINEKRAAPLNSIWFSDTGVSNFHTQQIHWLSNTLNLSGLDASNPNSIWVSEHLRRSKQESDWRTWSQTLERMDAELFAELNTGALEHLIFCGSHRCKVWVRRPGHVLMEWIGSLKASIFSRSFLASVFHEN